MNANLVKSQMLLLSSLSILLLSLLTFQPIVFFSYLSFLIFIVFFIFILNKYNDYFIVSFYTLVILLMSIGVSLITNYNVYMIEINEYSFSNRLTEKVTLQSMLYVLGSLSFFIFLKKSNIYLRTLTESNLFFINNLMRLTVVLILLVLLFVGLKYGIPSTYGVHRNGYWSYYAPDWGRHLGSWLIQTSFIVGFLYGKEGKKKDLYLYFVVLITLLIFGQRFTGLVQSIIFFITPYFIIRQIKFKLNLKMFVYSFLFIFLIASAVIVNLRNLGSSNSVGNEFMSRTVLQTQMWWALDNITTNYPQDVDFILKHYYGVGSEARDTGAYFLMYKVAPSATVTDRYETNSTFALSGIYNHLYFFGYFFGSLINVFFGFFWGVILFFLYKSILSGNLIAAFFSFKLMNKVQSLILTGVIPDLFEWSSLIFVLGFLMFIKLRKSTQ